MRETLLNCAIDHFGRLGFEGAATRAIAADCGTAMSSITYHFGGKEGLYLAAADHIAQQIYLEQEPSLIAALEPPATCAAEATDRLVALLDSLAVMMLSEGSARWARFITREQQEPTEAFERMYQFAMAPLVDCSIHLIGLARADLSGRERRATGFLLFGQVLGLRAARASLLKIMAPDPLDTAAQDLLRARLALHTRAILALPETAR